MKYLKKTLAIVLVMILLMQMLPMSTFAEGIIKPEETTLESEDNYVTEDEQPYILSESYEERTEYTKTFLMSDGSYSIAQYSQPVHYKSDDNEWLDYNNTLEKTVDGDFYTTTSRNDSISLSLYAKEGQTVIVDNENFPISWGYNNVKSSKLRINNKNINKKNDEKFTVLDNLVTTAEYKNVYPHVDLEYTIFSNEIKENLVLNNKNAASEYEITYNIGSLSAIQIDDKTIELKKGKDIIYTISAPVMYDSSDILSDDIYFSNVSDQNGILVVRLSADKTWINAKERSFPITIDPVILTKQDRDHIDTTFIADSSNYKDHNFSSQREMILGRESSAYGNCRTLLKFNLPALNAGDMIVSAKLNICVAAVAVYTNTISGVIFDAHKITSSWNMSSVKWNNKPSNESNVLDYTKINKGQTGWYEVDITRAAKEWYEGEANNGIMLKLHNESGSSAEVGLKATIWPERYNSQSGAYPVLTLGYRNNKGLEDYWTYTTASAGSAGAANINDYSGNLVFVKNVASTSGLKMPVSLDFIYNGYMADKYASVAYPKIGRGWKLNVQQTVKSSSVYGLSGDSLSNYPYAYEDGDGTVHFFYKKTENGTTQYLDEDGLGLELKTVSGGGYTIKDKEDNVMTFNTAGNLASIADAYGNTMSITYTTVTVNGASYPKITKITDGAGHKITFGFNDNGTFLKTITEPDGSTTTLSWSSMDDGTGGYISKITRPDGKYSSYTYNSKKRMEYAVSPDGTGLNFKYDSGNKAWRVKEIVEKAGSTTPSDMSNGQRITFDRNKYNSTVIRSSGADKVFNNDDDILTSYQFDNFGRTVSATSKRVSGTHIGANNYTYTAGSSTTDLKKVNKVATSSSVGRQVLNHIKNHSAESESNWSATTWINSSANYTASYDASQSLFGKKSLKVKVTQTTTFGGAGYQQNITSTFLTPGTSYTLSAYTKLTDDLASANSESQYGACVSMRFVLSDGSVVRHYSPVVNKTTVNGWQRIVLSETIPADTVSMKAAVLILNATGTAYFDGIQLEKTSSVSQYNLLENASFEDSSNNRPTNWSTSALESSDVISTTKMSGSYSMKIVG